MKNCGKDDMEMCNYPAFIIVNSFRKTFERTMRQNLSYLILSLCVMANAFVTKFIVTQKLRTPKSLKVLLQIVVKPTGDPSARRRAFFYFQQIQDFNFSFPWKQVVKGNAPYA